MRAVVVGGGLAGLAAALELTEGGHDVTLLEARPTLGGAVQTLPERAGDPSPPPDNGQHIALGCFTAYLDFLRRIGKADAVARSPLSLPVIDERGRVARVEPGPLGLLRYRHLALRDRLGVVRTVRALARLDPDAHDGETFGALLRRLGSSQAAIDRFWDVFVRPALNLRSDDASAAPGIFTVRTALLGARGASDLLLPREPLGELHGEAAGRELERRGATVRTRARAAGLDADAVVLDDGERVEGDAFVVALPPRESARLLDEPEPALDDSPIVSVHLLLDRRILEPPLAALLGSRAHWLFDRSALTGVSPSEKAPVRGSGPVEGVRGNREVPPWPAGCQYLTVVSSGAPELLALRGQALVAAIAGDVTARFGAAGVLWSRVSREPAATFAARPGTAALRRGARTARLDVARAGAWTATGWPATMEGAVRSGVEAARVLSDVATKVHA